MNAAYRKRPVEIEARQWDGTRAGIDALCRWANTEVEDEPVLSYIFTGPDDVSDVQIATLEGFLHVSPFDWIVKGVQGEFYPVKPDIFEETYEPVA